MEHSEYLFQVSPLDPDSLLHQVIRALEKRNDLLARKRYLRLWKCLDQFHIEEKAEKQINLLKKKRTRILVRLRGLLYLAAGIFLFVPGIIKPRELWFPLLLGVFAIGMGINALWQSKKNRKNPYDKPAKLFLAKRASTPKGKFQVSFSEEGMSMAEAKENAENGEAADKEFIPYGDFEYFIETDDLFLLTFGGQITVLQKQDLITDSIDNFRDFISAKTPFVTTSAAEVMEEPPQSAR